MKNCTITTYVTFVGSFVASMCREMRRSVVLNVKISNYVMLQSISGRVLFLSTVDTRSVYFPPTVMTKFKPVECDIVVQELHQIV